jgi:hypothetical protein
MNGVFYSALKLRSKTAHMIDESLPVQRAVEIIKQDLKGLAAPNGLLSGKLQSGGTTVSSAQQAGGTDLYTTTGTLSDDTSWGEIQKITYALRVSDTGNNPVGKDLYRIVTRNLLPTAQEQSVDQFLIGGVEQFNLWYHDGTQWKNSWDSTTDTNGLPKGIKVELVFAANEDEKRPKVSMQIVSPVMVQSLTNTALIAASGGTTQ